MLRHGPFHTPVTVPTAAVRRPIRRPRLITMATDPSSSALPSMNFQSLLTPTQVTFDPHTSPCPPTAHLQQEEESKRFPQNVSAPYGLEGTPAARLQLGRDGAGPAQGEGPDEPGGFHSYPWHLNNGADAPCLPHWQHPFDCFGSLETPETTPVTHPHSEQSEGSPELLPLTHLHPDQSESSRSWYQHSDGLQEFTLTGHQDNTQPTLYPKPIFSYSILIFLALSRSRTGSLPVSEIYSFMTDHFPYFKTAPDGWKNSVRHNLSLNKCFEKVEQRSVGRGRGRGLAEGLPVDAERRPRGEDAGGAAQVARKDPVSVRKSMARPEELDNLLSDWPERQRPGPAPGFHRRPFPGPPRPIRADPARRRTLQSHTPSLPIGRRPCYLPPPPNVFSYHPPSGPPPPACSPTPGSLEPPHGAALLGDHWPSRSAHELQTEGELANDIDTLNPSLTHLPLHGKLWEEVRDDSLAPPTTPGPSLLDGYLGNRGPTGEGQRRPPDRRVARRAPPSWLRWRAWPAACPCVCVRP
ncbi:hypothetical protein AAFF_G00256030 [Aldrovandia affinis]|uniref:Fork-head domain-containing protein n=1 Tax=Aldrovandia affinis TaxID=143900 RepID=A0AAD7W2T8_9TELE|nr:hypothetical protein AAFF_G00256030 [Aldrovandia affinis]